MKKIFLAILFLSCGDTEVIETSVPDQNSFQFDSHLVESSSIWICYHPETEHHNTPCVNDFFPNGCYVSGDNSKFCWELTSEDCSGKIDLGWQINNCHYLEE